MKKIKKFTNALVSTLLAIALVFQATPAIATEVDSKEPISRYSTDPEDIIASCAGSISNGTGYLTCYMPVGNFYATIQAKTAYNPNVTGAVECSVEFPDGTLQDLGTIPASNGVTPAFNVHICPYGQYRFIFECNFTDEIEVLGFIFD